MTELTPQLLNRRFNTVFSAPDGIKKLHGLILALAVQSRLVPQDPNDSPACELGRGTEAELVIWVMYWAEGAPSKTNSHFWSNPMP